MPRLEGRGLMAKSMHRKKWDFHSLHICSDATMAHITLDIPMIWKSGLMNITLVRVAFIHSHIVP